MKTLQGLKSVPPFLKNVVLTMGNFDGLHLGHRQLMTELLQMANRYHAPSTVITFCPHPLEVIRAGEKFKRIFPLEDMERQLRSIGIDYLIVEPFTKDLSQLEPQTFWFNLIQATLSPVGVVVGYDFGFGSGKKGGWPLLQSISQESGFSLKVVDPVYWQGNIVSSSRVRQLISEGIVKDVINLLGRPFSLSGKVIEGNSLGKSWGFPTANILPSATILPASGVYFTYSRVEKKEGYPSITNVGIAPTLETNKPKVKIETHCLAELDFSLYNLEMEVVFFDFLRKEKKFSSIDDLKKQIGSDVEKAKKYWTQTNPQFGPYWT